jgi:hypothetical protein
MKSRLAVESILFNVQYENSKSLASASLSIENGFPAIAPLKNLSLYQKSKLYISPKTVELPSKWTYIDTLFKLP